jgi:hypothetical protein
MKKDVVFGAVFITILVTLAGVLVWFASMLEATMGKTIGQTWFIYTMAAALIVVAGTVLLIVYESVRGTDGPYLIRVK